MRIERRRLKLDDQPVRNGKCVLYMHNSIILFILFHLPSKIEIEQEKEREWSATKRKKKEDQALIIY